MSAPSSFQLDPAPEGLYLPPSPPKHLKPDIYQNLDVFKNVDEHAIAESKKEYASVRDLLWNLIFKQNFTDLEKARAIFRWMTCRDFGSISFSGEVKSGSPEHLLLAFKSQKSTYARIFECLTRNAGLACVTITGWAKGVDYRPGVAITSQPLNHSWNAVYIDGDWQLVDSHWGTRFLQSESNVAENLVYEFDDFYFLTDPAQLAYTHRPQDSDWQLLEKPQTASQFEDYPLVKSYFFTNKMHFLPDLDHGVMYSKRGICALSVGFTGKTGFTFKLMYGENMSEKVGHTDLNRYVLQETKDKMVEYRLRLPCRGDFYLIIFAHLDAENIPASENVFKAVCEYKIIGGNDVPSRVDPFPSCSDLTWGPDTFVSRYGLRPHKTEALLKAPNGRADVAFDKSRPDIRVYARLVRDGVPDSELRSAVGVKNENDKVSVDVRLARKGEYGLEIFANDPEKEGDMFTHVCQYLCIHTDGRIEDLYGKLPGKEAEILERRAGVKEITAADLAGEADAETPETVNEYTATYPFGESVEAEEIVPLHAVEPEEEYQPHSADLYHGAMEEKPPEDFQVVAVESKDVAVKPDACTLSTHKLFIDTTVFADVDTHALEVSKMEELSFRDILWHLVYARKLQNQLDIARAIFLWLCSKDLSKLKFPDPERGSPEEILMNLQQGYTTYARVYEMLCSYAGLHCKTLTGYAKGADYKPGMKFVDHPSQHSWNTVLVNGRWQLVDCHWAARRLVGQKAQQQAAPENVRYELDEYYFMPAPSQLVFTHFPDDPDWQLLERPIDLEEFESLVPLKPTFFKYGLHLLSHTNAVITCPADRDVSVRIECPRKKVKDLKFTFNLTKEDGTDEFNGVKLNRFALQEIVGNICYVTLRPPEKASYLLVIYAKDSTDKTKEGVYGGICEYKIVSEEDRVNPCPFPPCVHTTWGPGDSASKFDMVPLQTGSILLTYGGIAEARFRMATKLRFLAKLKSNGADEKELAQNLLFRIVGKLAIFRVHIPNIGEYGLEIYANDPETGGTSLQHAYQYLVICRELPSSPLQLFPALPSSALGPQPSFEQCGLSTISHIDPYIVTDSGDLQLAFGKTQPVRVTSQLSLLSENPARDCSEYILQQGGTDTALTFMLKLPQAGMYKFQLFATLQSAATESLPGVYAYLINCQQTVGDMLPFPKQFGPWKEGCYLYEPIEGHLQPSRLSIGSASSHQHVFFKMDVLKAQNVAVVVGSEWTQLDQKEPGTWHGEVLMEKHWEKERKVTVCANYGATATSYSTLLEYSM